MHRVGSHYTGLWRSFSTSGRGRGLPATHRAAAAGARKSGAARGSVPRWGGCHLEPACPVLALLAVLLLRGCLGAPKARQHTEGLLLYRERLFFLKSLSIL